MTQMHVVMNICFAAIPCGKETTKPKAIAPRSPPYERMNWSVKENLFFRKVFRMAHCTTTPRISDYSPKLIISLE
jgi:hypothetical protein